MELRCVVADGCEVYLQGGISYFVSPVLVANIPMSARPPHEERQWRFIRIADFVPSSGSGTEDYLLAAKLYQAGGSTDVSFWAELVVKTPPP